MAIKQPSTAITTEIQAATKALSPALKRLTKALAADFTKLPVGVLADFLYDLRQLGAQIKAVTAPFDDVLGPAIKEVEEHFVNSLAIGESSGVQGTYSRVQITESAVPVVKPEDWLKLYAYIAKTKQWELLTHAVSKEAIRERWAEKKQVKFVGVFHAKKVSCTKLTGKGGR